MQDRTRDGGTARTGGRAGGSAGERADGRTGGRAVARTGVLRLAGVAVLVLTALPGASEQPAEPGSGPPRSVAPLDSPTSASAADAGPADRTAGTAAPGPAPTAPDTRSPSEPAVTAPDGPPPFDALPEAPPPTTVPYAIGTRVYFAGRSVDLAAAFPTSAVAAGLRQFDTVTGAAGAAWTQITRPGPDGTVVHLVGRLSAAGVHSPFHDSTGPDGRHSSLAVTTGGAVAMPENGQVHTMDGALLAAFTGSPAIDCGFCDATAAGPRLVIDQWTGPPERPEHQATWLWYPPASIQKLDDRFVAVGRLGSGWLGLRLGDGCWRLAPTAAPDRLGATVCSLTTPLVSSDGRSAVVVQDRRVRVVDPVTGARTGTAAMGALGTWEAPATGPAAAGPAAGSAIVSYAVPAAWETDDAYLVTARVGDALALVRCSVRTGACARVVRATTRPGVDHVVTERGPDDAVVEG